ncbi:hypothetical protein FEM08_15210 [Flavobacterium gilvum]|nr:hypothetical protein FEM08_15210 [Flavobacterium gilvum]
MWFIYLAEFHPTVFFICKYSNLITIICDTQEMPIFASNPNNHYFQKIKHEYQPIFFYPKTRYFMSNAIAYFYFTIYEQFSSN